jgi:hypothetical protein
MKIVNQDSSEYTTKLKNFKGSNLEGKRLNDSTYVVYSYGWYPIYVWKNNYWYKNEDVYNQIIKKQMFQSRPEISNSQICMIVKNTDYLLNLIKS